VQHVSRKILIVDDDAATRRLLRGLLGSEFQLAEAASGEKAIEVLPAFCPDLVLLDIMLPGIDGCETCRRIKAGQSDAHIVMISATSSLEQQVWAFQHGADDYLVKPFDAQDLRARIRLHFHLREATAAVSAIRAEIESHHLDIRKLAERHAEEVLAIQDTAVFTLAKVAESRDQETGGHLVRMRAYSQILAEELARSGPYADQINRQFLQDLFRSSPLHDIGKVGIRDEILLKPGRLTLDEFETMKQHTVIGANILDQAVTRLRGGGFLAMAALIARYHHEQFDGTGYPVGLEGQEIPLPARIVAVADVYDALTSVRPYKPAYPICEAETIIRCDAGRHFDPVIVEAFRRRFDDFLRAKEEAADDFPFGYGAMAFREYDMAGAEA
jgi:response regulator RpfG family c-di-GMP phosphodiesterase